MSWENILDVAPYAADDQALFDQLTSNPHALWRLLYDVYDAVLTEQERAQGIVRKGRRKPRPPTSMAEFWSVVMPPPFTHKPFPEALSLLLNGRSHRELAERVGCDKSTVTKLCQGTRSPSMEMVEAIAGVFGVEPTFFVEYRARKIALAVEALFRAEPNRSSLHLEVS